MATSSSAGSAAFFSIALLVIALLVLLLLRHYLPIRSTPAYLLIPVFLALFLPCSIILLVPIDLASNATVDGPSRAVWLSNGVMLAIWRIAYWLTFVLTWFVLPLLGDYADAGHRDPRARLNYSIRTNLRYQLVIFGAGAITLVYFFLQAGAHITNLKATVMALAYAWGLILAIYLMGHGLVDIPRRLFKSASIANRLRQLQSHAPRVHERMLEAIENLSGLEQQVLQLKRRKTGTARDFQDWIDELALSSDLPESRTGTSTTETSANDIAASSVPAVITDRYLADLTRKLKRARHRRIRFIEEWDRLVHDAIDTQAILDSTASKRLEFPSSQPPSPTNTTTPARKRSPLSRIRLLTPTTRYLLHVRLLPFLRLVSSFILTLASIALIWTESTHPISPKLSLISLTLLIPPSTTNSTTTTKQTLTYPTQLLTATWLLYMSTCALSSIRTVKTWGNRALVRRHTYPESATWYALQVAKLTVPLSYNFITLLPPGLYEESAFYGFLGRQVDLTAVGTGFSRFFPMFILLPVVATSFGLYGKVKRIAGFGVFEDPDEGSAGEGRSGGWREGKSLIERERLTHTAGAAGGNGVGLASRGTSPRPQAPRAGYTDALDGATNQRAIRPYSDTDTDDERHENMQDSSSNSTAEWAELASSLHPPPPHSTSSSYPPRSTTQAQSAPLNAAANRRPQQQQQQQQQRYTDAEDEEDSGFFSDFAHRVRNTLDTVERPAFLGRVERPRWLRGGNTQSTSAGGSTGGNAGGNRLGRLFGGGGVRL